MVRRKYLPNEKPAQVHAREDIQAFLDDYKIPAALDHLKTLAGLSVGKRGTLAWISHVRLAGLMLATLTDEEYQTLCVAYLSSLNQPKSKPKPLAREKPSVKPRLF